MNSTDIAAILCGVCVKALAENVPPEDPIANLLAGLACGGCAIFGMKVSYDKLRLGFKPLAKRLSQEIFRRVFQQVDLPQV
jgi:hypothetical protein